MIEAVPEGIKRSQPTMESSAPLTRTLQHASRFDGHSCAEVRVGDRARTRTRRRVNAAEYLMVVVVGLRVIELLVESRFLLVFILRVRQCEAIYVASEWKEWNQSCRCPVVSLEPHETLILSDNT